MSERRRQECNQPVWQWRKAVNEVDILQQIGVTSLCQARRVGSEATTLYGVWKASLANLDQQQHFWCIQRSIVLCHLPW